MSNPVSFLVGAVAGAIGVIAVDEAIKAYDSENKVNEGDLTIKLSKEEWEEWMAHDEKQSESVRD